MTHLASAAVQLYTAFLCICDFGKDQIFFLLCNFAPNFHVITDIRSFFNELLGGSHCVVSIRISRQVETCHRNVVFLCKLMI